METNPDKNYHGAEVRLCNDGKYRWEYQLNMLTNPTILLVVLKIFAWIIGIGWVIMCLSALFRGDWEALRSLTLIMLAMAGGFLVLSILGYLIVAWMYGGKYIVRFEMGDKEIKHIQQPAQFKRARKIGLLTAVVGAASKRPTTAGAGLMAAGKSTSTSVYSHVKRIKPFPRRHLIKVNESLEKNQIYVRPEDFDFVLDFLRSHCPEAKQ